MSTRPDPIPPADGHATPLPQLNPTPDSTPAAAVEHPFYQEQLSRMRRHLETVRDLPGLEKLRENGELPAAFFEHLNAALACYDRMIDFVLDFDPAAPKIQCTKGCCNCCIDLVRGVTTPEAINIYHHVRSWPDARQVFEYHRQSAELFMEILASKLRPGEASFGGRDPRVAEAHVEYNLLNRPCGFLDRETGCCRIYPVRPVACRYFFSLDPPEFCTPTNDRYLSRQTQTIHLPEEIHGLLLEIGRRFDFHTLTYLAGAFCGFAAEVMRTRPIRVIDGGAGPAPRP